MFAACKLKYIVRLLVAQVYFKNVISEKRFLLINFNNISTWTKNISVFQTFEKVEPDFKLIPSISSPKTIKQKRKTLSFLNGYFNYKALSYRLLHTSRDIPRGLQSKLEIVSILHLHASILSQHMKILNINIFDRRLCISEIGLPLEFVQPEA